MVSAKAGPGSFSQAAAPTTLKQSKEVLHFFSRDGEEFGLDMFKSKVCYLN